MDAEVGCYKRGFESQGIAEVIIDEIITSGNREGKYLSTYKCDICEMWHLTSRQ